MYLDLIEKTTQLFGPSSCEDDVLNWCEHYLSDCRGITIKRDRLDNLIITYIPPTYIDGNEYPRKRSWLMLSAHADQVGFIVSHIDDDGFVYVQPLGGFDTGVLLGQRVLFKQSNGDYITGVLNRSSIHLLDADEEKSTPEFEDLWVDFGVYGDDISDVSVGDVGILQPSPIIETFDYSCITGPALDNRLGLSILMHLIKRWSQEKVPLKYNIVVVINRNEESGNFVQAAAAAGTTEPDLAIVIDVAPSTDTPGVEKSKHGDLRLCGGVGIGVGVTVSRRFTSDLINTARVNNIKYQKVPLNVSTGTDADGIIAANRGTPVVVLYVPCRYLHTPTEMVHTNDVEGMIVLLEKFVCA